MDKDRITSLMVAGRAGVRHNMVLMIARKIETAGEMGSYAREDGRRYPMMLMSRDEANRLYEAVVNRARRGKRGGEGTDIDQAELVRRATDGGAVTTSLMVASVFGKRHSNVLQDIDQIGLKVHSAEIFHSYFHSTTYTDDAGKENRMYEMTKDGFTLLVMGYNGLKAMAFKLKYIDAFNQMEKQLRAVTASYMIDDPVERALAWAEEQKQLRRLEEQTKAQQAQLVALTDTVNSMQKKSDYYDMILMSKGTVTVTQIAQDYGMSAKAMNHQLAKMGIQHKVGGQWILYGRYVSGGYVSSRAVQITRTSGQKDVVMNTEWTQKGRLWLYDELKKVDVLPMIEKQ